MKVDTSPDRQQEKAVEAQSDAVAELQANKILNTLGERLAEMQVDKRN